MKILSKKTGLPQEIPMEQWEQMKKNGDNRLYTVEDPTDDNLGSVEVVVEPIPMAFESNEVNLEEERKWYMEALDEKGIKYQANTGIKKLKKKYEESL